MAAAALIMLGIFAMGWSFLQQEPTVLVAQQEVIHVIDPQGQQRSVLLIRQGDRSTVIEAEALDHIRGENAQVEPNARPVRMRY
jgi:hypothetical protein